MPLPYVVKLARKHRISVDQAEQYWAEAKKSAYKQGRSDDYAYITGIFKKIMGESMKTRTRKSKLSIAERLISSEIAGKDTAGFINQLCEGFMEPEVYETDYILIDTNIGTECIPADVVDYQPSEEDQDSEEIPDELRDYVEGNEMYSIERKHGWVGRMQAPGYLDATDWSWGDTEEEVMDQLREYYGLNDEEDLEDEDLDDDDTEGEDDDGGQQSFKF
jgi:hypothetical protein